MLVHRLRLVLPLVSAAMFLAAVGIVAWAIWVPCQIDDLLDTDGAGQSQRPVAKAASPASAKKPARANQAAVLERRYQAPIFDPPPEKPPVVEKKVPPPPPVKLVATMPEPDGGSAMFAGPEGRILIRKLGEQVVAGHTARLEKIANDHVVLRQDEQAIKMPLAKE